MINIEQQVRKRAYELWLRDGMTQGRDIEHWCAAERELLQDQKDEPLIEIVAAPPKAAVAKPRAARSKKK